MKYPTDLMTALACVVLAALSGCHTGPQPTLLYISSYHPGYASSDAITAGIYDVVADSRAHLDVFFMDTKRYPQPEAIAAKTEEALRIIRDIKPDVIIASDDNAVKFVVVEHFREGPIPCVFCGVNWTCEPYGLPTGNVTGMLEVLPVRETVEALRQDYPDMKNLLVLSENTVSEQKNKAILGSIFSEVGLTTTYTLVETYNEWKAQFVKANRETDVIFIPTNGAIKDWDEADAKAFVLEHIRVPVFTCDDFMMNYAVFGLAKVAQEQGQWAARTALQILRGKSPSSIPVTRNRQTIAYVNMALAERIGWVPSEELIKRSRKVK